MRIVTVGRGAAGLALAILLVSPASGVALSSRPSAASGPLIAISASTGRPQPFPRVRGSAVFAIVDDGGGGWFIGGEFSSIGGVGCRNLAHVRSGGVVDRGFCPRPDATVRALARLGSVLYVGGQMSHIAGAKRSALAALDTTSGHALPWNPGASVVLQLAVDQPRGQLLVTGEFGRLGGKLRNRLGAVRLDTGAATRFAPDPDQNSHGDSVFGAVATADAIYAWGFFGRIGGKPRDSFARLDPVTGRALPQSASAICATQVAPAGSRLYVASDATCAKAKLPLVAFGLPGLRPLAWHPAIPRTQVEAFAADPEIVVAAAVKGHFDQAEPRVILAVDEAGHRVFLSRGHPVGAVEAVQISRPLVLLGGLFGSVTQSG